MAAIPFWKLQGAGNDFILVDNRPLGLDLACFPALARRVCARRLSLGGDALMVVVPPTHGGDLGMRFYNADGSEGEMCGNGARCLARYAFETGHPREQVIIETVSGDVMGWRLSQREYRIRLNPPSVLDLDRAVTVDGAAYDCAYVELGRPGLPHAVVRLPGLAEKSLEAMRPLGAALRSHPAFPKGANVNFWDWEGDGAVRLLTFERGVEDFTLACGTGSGSIAAVLVSRGLTQADPLTLRMAGGVLKVQVERVQDRIANLYLMGDTNLVARGELTDEELSL